MKTINDLNVDLFMYVIVGIGFSTFQIIKISPLEMDLRHLKLYTRLPYNS